MLTVYEVLTGYCKEKAMAPPTTDDLKQAGAMISHHFKKFWAPKQVHYEDTGIPDCGFTKSLENGKLYVVPAYPNIFKDDMIARIEVYFKNKVEGRKPVKKERKRTQSQKPAYSTKKNK